MTHYSFEKHGIFTLLDRHERYFKRIWDVILSYSFPIIMYYSFLIRIDTCRHRDISKDIIILGRIGMSLRTFVPLIFVLFVSAQSIR